MIDVVSIGSRFIGDVLRSIRASRPRQVTAEPNSGGPAAPEVLDDLAARALTTVFGMDASGRIKREKARHVVEKLGLIGGEEEGAFENEDFDLRAEEIVGGLMERDELLRQAFTVFDEDGDGFIEAVEVKRVLECLGLASGWEMKEFERMVEAVDLNFDGKVDFGEFELMMMGGKD